MIDHNRQSWSMTKHFRRGVLWLTILDAPVRLADHALYIGEKCPYCRCYSILYFSEFQKKVFFQFARLEKKLDRLAKQYEPNISEYHLVQMSTLDEFDELEVKITEENERKLLVRHIHS